MFGNTFDRPLKLPWGSGAALKFMQYVSDSPSLHSHGGCSDLSSDFSSCSFVDPTLEHALDSATPWALYVIWICFAYLPSESRLIGCLSDI